MEVKWFNSEKERLAYLRQGQQEYPLKVAKKTTKKGTTKKSAKDKAD